MTLRLCLAQFCLGSKMTKHSTCCRCSTKIAKSLSLGVSSRQTGMVRWLRFTNESRAAAANFAAAIRFFEDIGRAEGSAAAIFCLSCFADWNSRWYEFLQSRVCPSVFLFKMVDVLVSVTSLLAAMVGVTIGTPKIPSFHFFVSHPRLSWDSLCWTSWVHLSRGDAQPFLIAWWTAECFTSFLLFGRDTPLSTSKWSFHEPRIHMSWAIHASAWCYAASASKCRALDRDRQNGRPQWQQTCPEDICLWQCSHWALFKSSSISNSSMLPCSFMTCLERTPMRVNVFHHLDMFCPSALSFLTTS